MANLNLSEFTDKLFVADADHTFIWDTAASISKRVSRNSWLNSGTLTSDAPVTISQTWNNAAVAFTGLKVNAVSTASADASLLLDLQLGGVTQVNSTKAGSLFARIFVSGNSQTSRAIEVAASGIAMGSLGVLAFAPASSYASNSDLFNVADTFLRRDGAPNTLALRNGAAAQTFNVYGTSSASNANYARLALTCGLDGNATISTQALGTGTAGTVSINGVPVGLGKGNLSSNIAIGTSAMAARTDGGEATALGSLSLLYATNVSRTTAIGYGAGATLGNGAQNTSSLDSVFIGYDTRSFAINQSNQIVIGNSTTGIGSNSVVLGNDSITKTALKGNVGIGTTAPAVKLDVVGDSRVSAGSFNVDRTGGNFSNIIQFRARAAGDGSYFGSPVGNGAGEMVSLGLSGLLVGSINAVPLVLGTNNVERLRILSTGEVGIGTTSPTSKLHVAGDAVLTGDLLGTNYTIGVPTILTQSNISITNNHSGVADSAIVITPKGTGGVIFGPKPDGTTTGGNARGIYSVDLQTAAKTGPAQVASGAYSALVGGQANRASGAHSFCGGGNSNTPSGTFSVTCGGQSNIASGGQSFIGGGVGNTASSTNAFIAGGIQGLADRFSISAHSSGQFATTGDAQTTKAVFRNKTTTNSAVELFLDGASTRYAVTSGKIISMLINITGTKSDGSAVAHYVRQYSIKNIGGTTSQVYAAVTVGTDNAAGTSIAISADATNNSLKIEATGVAAETWRWVASVDAVEVGHGV